MLSPESLKNIRRLQIRTSRRVSEALAGQYRSAFRGRGMEFEEVRPYLIGDDVRSIDWNVSARVGDPHVKIFREERELTVILAVDLSASLAFGTQGKLKRELAAEIAGTLAFSATRSNDKVGLLLFTDRIERFVPPKKGARHVLRIARDLLAFEPTGRATDLPGALDELNRVQRRHAVICVLSDFDGTGWERPLALLKRRHDLIPIVVGDRAERALPNVGLTMLEDLETGERRVIDTGSRAVRAAYAAKASERAAAIDRSFRRINIEPVLVETGEDFVPPLLACFRKREGRHGAAASRASVVGGAR